MKTAEKFTVPMDYTHFGYQFLEDMGDGLHLGVDLNYGKPWDDEGKQVNATASGEIVYSKSSKTKRGWGNLIIIKHQLPDGKIIYTRYAHLKERWIAEGQPIECGAGIGLCGHTGTVYPHLHWDAFVEKFIKDGNQLTAYPQRWNQRKLLQYFFDPLQFVKTFSAEAEEENCKKELAKCRGEVESLKGGLEEIAEKLKSLPGDHHVEPTISSISGEIDGWLELESQLEECQEKCRRLAQEDENFYKDLAKMMDMSSTDRTKLLTHAKSLVSFKKDHENDKKAWGRKEKELKDKIEKIKKNGGEEKWPKRIIQNLKKLAGALSAYLQSRS